MDRKYVGRILPKVTSDKTIVGWLRNPTYLYGVEFKQIEASENSIIMIIIGERINSSRKKIAEAVKKRDSSLLRREIKAQEAAGADMIDLNVGTFG